MTRDELYVSAIMLIPYVLFAALFLAAAYGVVRLAVSRELEKYFQKNSRRKRLRHAERPRATPYPPRLPWRPPTCR